MKLLQNKVPALVVLFVLTNMYPRWLPKATSGDFCKWQALSILLLTAYTAIPFEKTTENYICRWAMILAMGNTFDEYFGDPIHVTLVEISFAVIVTIWAIYQIIKCPSRHI